ncbi:MAG TPA: tetratricopeptide repeat protein [Opitutaceae bacterium]|nr:tetratricopeptide repeat protein [Opitutaceae bacterium]
MDTVLSAPRRIVRVLQMTGCLQATSRPRPILAAVVLVAAIAAAYFNSLHGAFVWDDVPTIVNGKSFEKFATVFARPAAVNTTSGRPLVSLSLFLNYALDGRNPVGFHIFNVLVHAAAALALLGFVRRLALLPRWGGRFAPHATGLALGVAAVWAVHPLQTQAVAFVIQRAESLMGLFYLLTLYCFIRGATEAPRPRTTGPNDQKTKGLVGMTVPCSAGPPTRSPLTPSFPQSFGPFAPWSLSPSVWYGLSVLSCALGMTAKEVMASAPVVVLLFDRTFLAGSFRQAFTSKKLFYGALFGTWLILLWLVISLGGNRDGSTGGFSAQAAWGPYWLTQFPAIATYLKLTFFPHPLIFQYGSFWLPNVAAALPGALVVVPLVGLTVVALFRRPAIGFFGFWFFSILAVTSLVPGTVDMIVEYRMYVALAPFWILVAAGLYLWRPRLAPAVLGAAALAFAAVTVARNRDYRSQLSLWTDNVAKRPGNALARYNLAVSLLGEPGRTAEAEAQLEAALKLQPDIAVAHYNLGWLLGQQPGQADRAIAHYEEAVRLAPGYAQAHNNLAVLLHERGQLQQACRHFQLAVQYDPGNCMAWLNLVRVLEELARPDDAVEACSALVRAHPDFASGQTKLGILLVTRQRPAEAIPHLEAALRLDPTQSAAGFCLGTVLVQRGERLPEATALLEAAAREQPDSAIAHFTLGRAFLAAGSRLQDAIAQFTAAVQLDPRFAMAHFDLAAALELADGNRTDALTHYRTAATLQPEVAEIHFRLARLLAADPQARGEARAELEKALALDPHLSGAQALLRQLAAAGK